MIKSNNRRKNISKRIAAAQARARPIRDEFTPERLRLQLECIGVEVKKQYPWERTFHNQDAAGTHTQGGD
jgi:hypothetical protein